MKATVNKALSVSLFVIVMACCCLLESEARPVEGSYNVNGRHLLYTCSEAKGLSGNCATLCDCVKNAGRTVDNCAGLCQSCVDATANCPADDSLPQACAEYSGAKEVQDCIAGRASSGRRFY